MKHAYIAFLLLFILLINSCTVVCAHMRTCLIDTINYERDLSRIDSFMPQPVSITAITLKVDITVDDLYQLLDKPADSEVDSAYLKKLVFYIVQKNKFRTIQLTFDQDTQKIEIYLESVWTFDRLIIKGIFIGRATYSRLYALQPGDYFDQEMHDYSVRLIQKKLKDEGYFNASIMVKIDGNELLKTKSCTMTITPGPCFTVKRCAIQGIDDWDIAHAMNVLAAKQVNAAYSQQAITDLLLQIQTRLTDAGYYLINSRLEKRIDSAAAVIDIDLILEVSGKRIFRFRGNGYFTPEQLKERLLLFGQSAWILPLEVLAQEIQMLYRENRFDSARVTVHQEGADCSFYIHEGERSKDFPTSAISHVSVPELPVIELVQFYFGKTVLQNCSRLPSSYILRELDYQEGQSWDQERVNESLLRLRQLEIFDRISLYPLPNPWCAEEKTMLLKVHEDDSYEVRMRMGIGLQQMSKKFTFRNVSYVAGGAFLIKNPFNYADQFLIDGEYTHGEQTFSARYTRPWIFDLPIKATCELYATQYLQPGFRNNQKNIYSFVQQGFLCAFNYRRRIIDAQLNTGVEWMETTVVDKKNAPFFSAEITRALNFEPLLVDKKISYILFEPTLVIDRVHNKLNPMEGSLGLLSVKGMFPLRLLSSNSFFLRIFIDQSVYIPVYHSVLALRARLGHIFYKDFKNVMPAERFYLGGANSIRSYETDMCPPLGAIVNDHGKACFVPQGTRSMITLNAELRVPIYRNFWGTIFQDLGALSNNHFADIKPHTVVAGTGFGLRYNTPVGPLRFDIAWKWHRPNEAISRYCWFLSFGNAF